MKSKEARVSRTSLRGTALATMLALGMGIVGVAHAQTSGSSYVVNDVNNYSHPYAATDSANLATKMQLMNTSAFSFYHGTADLFYRDMMTLPSSGFTSTVTC